MPGSGPVRELARAKVNLALHVVGRRADGYHRLDSLVAFASVGDTLTAEPTDGNRVTLSVSGPFARDVPDGNENLILKSAETLTSAFSSEARRGAALHLDKQLPVASGIGGGSADAAAAIRALCRLWGIEARTGALAELALSLGADVPMCLASTPLRAQGIGEVLTPLPPLPAVGIVLANPGVAVSTPSVFRSLESRDNPPLPDPPASFDGVDALVAYLSETRNDLEPPAIGLAPEIAGTADALRATEGCLIARMSGSGATCFALYRDETSAGAAAAAIARTRPDWWVEAGTI